MLAKLKPLRQKGNVEDIPLALLMSEPEIGGGSLAGNGSGTQATGAAAVYEELGDSIVLGAPATAVDQTATGVSVVSDATRSVTRTVRSRVVPPAPYVTLTKSGSRSSSWATTARCTY